MTFKKSIEFALELDKKDPLASYQDKFYFPIQNNGDKYIYLCGNSLGLQSKNTEEFVQQELEDWKALELKGIYTPKTWLPYHEFLSSSYSKIVGAKENEVVAMNTLSVNPSFNDGFIL